MAEIPSYDVIILGAGFSGCSLLYHLRKAGYNVHIFEKAPCVGGTWYWNHYPGARVDSNTPMYELDIPEVYNTWNWSQRFPDWQELREYFKHADKVLEVSKDTDFNTTITDAVWDEVSQTWTVTAENGKQARAKFFLACVGFCAKNFTPDFKGLSKFKGEVYHSNEWPEGTVDLSGRRIGLIGTGSTGVQITQEAGPVCEELFVFQRTPNLCLHMKQEHYDPSAPIDKAKYEEYFKQRITSFGGFLFDFLKKKAIEDTPEEREKLYEELYAQGGFQFWVANYHDVLLDAESNKFAYDFWQRKVSARIMDPKIAEILAPKVAPHPFGTKRPSLEQNYYEQFNRPNVHVVDVNAEPIAEFTENGMRTSAGEYKFDLLILATGFDALTGSYKHMNIKGINGVDLNEKWAEKTRTYLGMTVHDFPNMFFTYGPQAPTAFSNGPSCIQVQTKFILDTLNHMRDNKLTSFNATGDAEMEYTTQIGEDASMSLFPLAKSWYMGANIPGKAVEMLNYIRGLPAYVDLLDTVEKENWKGVDFAPVAVAQN
ncbi:hypothetical protein BZA70DRAFT_134641 [Myxozyma melibiosi]|uniref:FAD/NAD(P)-binding domain-containing protein n=1 Tax=Myxozyma melibiosi TaxID=54550 RepID=A0ABR1F992_9ASCO